MWYHPSRHGGHDPVYHIYSADDYTYMRTDNHPNYPFFANVHAANILTSHDEHSWKTLHQQSTNPQFSLEHFYFEKNEKLTDIGHLVTYVFKQFFDILRLFSVFPRLYFALKFLLWVPIPNLENRPLNVTNYLAQIDHIWDISANSVIIERFDKMDVTPSEMCGLIYVPPLIGSVVSKGIWKHNACSIFISTL